MKKVLFVMLAACAVAACSQKEIVDNQPASFGGKTFHAVIEQNDTKVYNDGLNLYWENEDEITVFDKTNAPAVYSFDGSDGSTSGDFTLASPASGTGDALENVYAVYPYDAVQKAAEGELLVSLYDDQTPFFVGDIDTYYSNIMVAFSKDNSLSFRNIGGYLRISLWGKDTVISGIYVTTLGGEKISGDMIVTFDSDGLPVTTPSKSNTNDYVYHEYASPVGLKASDAEATDFYFILPPGTYSGFEVEVIDQYQQSIFMKVSSEVTIYRNKVTSFPVIGISFPEIVSTLDCGAYTITDELYPQEAIPFSLSPTDDPAQFLVTIFGSTFCAEYDETASTLTVSGIEKGYESDGSVFGYLYGYYDSARTMAYGFFVYADENSNGDDALVFDVDPVSGKLTKINQEFDIRVYRLSDYSYLGSMGYASAGSAVTKQDAASLSAPATKAAPASLKTPARAKSIKRELNGGTIRHNFVEKTNLRSR